MDSPMDGYWYSVFSYFCGNQLGPKWLGQFEFFFPPSQPLDFPKKNVGIFLDPPNHINTTPSHPLAYLPTTDPSLFFFPLTFSPTYFKWPSLIPTYLLAHPSTYQVPLIYLPTYPSTPTHLSMSYTSHKHEEMLTNLDAELAIHVALSNDEIQWKYCNSSCKWLCRPSTFVPTSHPSKYLSDTTQTYLLAWW